MEESDIGMEIRKKVVIDNSNGDLSEEDFINRILGLIMDTVEDMHLKRGVYGIDLDICHGVPEYKR